MSNVRTVKSQMNVLNSTIQVTNNSINNVLSTVDSVNDSNCNSVIPPCEKLLNDLGNLQSILSRVYSLTSAELHIFFEEYNREMNENILLINQVIPNIVELMAGVLILHGLYLMSMAMEGFLKYDLSMSEFEGFVFPIRDLSLKLQLLNQSTMMNNSKLIIKNNRG